MQNSKQVQMHLDALYHFVRLGDKLPKNGTDIVVNQ